MSDRDTFAQHMEPVARLLLGDPNPLLSTKTELRWGTHGSLAINLDAGTFYDHEAESGGGVKDLVIRQTGLKNGGWLDWMRDNGFGLPEREEPAGPAQRNRIAATYDYRDENDDLVFQVVRMEPKDFRQRRRARPDDEAGKIRDGWVWSVKGIPLVPYRLPELSESIASGHLVILVEGEKDVDNLRLRGIPATCNPMGAGKWTADLSRHFQGADIVIVPDNDEAGRKHRDLVAGALNGVARRVRSLDLPGLGPKQDVSDWIEAGGSAEELYHLIESRALRPGDEPFRSRYGALWLHEIPGRSSGVSWIVKGLVPARGFGAIVGPPGCGKSFLALHLAWTVSVLALAEGEDARWFGRRVHPCGVAYVAAEGQGGFIRRVEAMLRRYRVDDLRQYPFVLIPSNVDLRSPEGDTAPLIAELKALDAQMFERTGVRLGLVVFDTLNRVMSGGDENSPEDMGAIIRNCGRISNELHAHPTVLPIHHMNASGTRERGHSSLKGALDFMVEVEKTETGNVAKFVKQKDEADGQEFGFTLTSQVLGLDQDGDAVTSCVAEPVEAPRFGPRPASKRLPAQPLNAYNILFRHCDDAGQRRYLAGKDRLCSTVAAWQAECARQNLVAPGSTDDALRKAFQRAFDLLRAEQRIGVEGDFVFPILRGFNTS